jgi:hypothetical protein
MSCIFCAYETLAPCGTPVPPILIDETDPEDRRLVDAAYRRGWLCRDCAAMYERDLSRPACPQALSIFLDKVWFETRRARAQRLVLHHWARALRGEL